MNADSMSGGRQLSDQANQRKSAVGQLPSTSTSAILLLLSLKADTHFYHPLESRRLSQLRNCRKGAAGAARAKD